jgi:phosphohistidine phosphatase
MKTLCLARHTKASWDTPGVDDFHRPLLPKGIQRSKKAIRFLNEKQVKADKIVSSPAVRAFETAKLIADGIGFPKKNIVLDPCIYDGPVRKIMSLIYATEDEVNILMIFGHNPLITQLAAHFLGPEVEFIPTMGIACISFDVDKWNAIPLAHAKNEFILLPKTL